jgi:transcriptional regulator with GAF, ATPase, and Fis domain
MDQCLKRLDDLDALDDSLKRLVAQRFSDLEDAYGELTRSQFNMQVRLTVLSALEPATSLVDRLGRALEAILCFDRLGLQKKGGIFRRDPEEGVLELLVTRGEFDEVFLESERRVPLGSCLCGRVAVDGEILQSDDCFADTRHRRSFPGMEAHGHCIVPLKSGTEIKGVLFLYTDPNPDWNPERIDTLREIGLALGAAIHREEALQLLTAQQMFVTLSHEINNPLQIIMGTTDSLLGGSKASGDTTEKLQVISKAALRIADMVERCRHATRVNPTPYRGETEMLKLAPASAAPGPSRREIPNGEGGNAPRVLESSADARDLNRFREQRELEERRTVKKHNPEKSL